MKVWLLLEHDCAMNFQTVLAVYAQAEDAAAAQVRRAADQPEHLPDYHYEVEEREVL